MTLQNQPHHQKGKYQTLEMEKLKTRNSTLTSSDAKEREMRSPVRLEGCAAVFLVAHIPARGEN